MKREETKKRIIEELVRVKKCIRKSTLAGNLQLSSGYVGTLLSELRKEKEVGIYLNKYWGIK